MKKIVQSTGMVAVGLGLMLGTAPPAAAAVSVYGEIKAWGVYSQATASSSSDPRFQAWAQRAGAWNTGACRDPWYGTGQTSNAFVGVSGSGGGYGWQHC